MIITPQSQNESEAVKRINSLVSSLKERRCISLFIETSSLCNLKCQFCGFQNDNHIKSKGIMLGHVQKELYRILANSNMEYININFYNHGEPLCNKHTVDIVRQTLSLAKASRYCMVTNGLLLDTIKLAELVDSGITDFKVSLDIGERLRYAFFKGVDCFDKVKSNIDKAINYIYSNNLDLNFTIKACKPLKGGTISNKDTYDVMELYRNICEKSQRIHLEIWDEYAWKSTSGLDVSCEAPFTQCVINFDGTISPCCVDTDYKLQLGNISNYQSLDEVFFGNRVRSLRRSMIDHEIPIPRHCVECGVRTCVDVSKWKHILVDLI